MNPSRRKSAVFVCGMPLPRAFGKYRFRRNPVISAPDKRRQHTAPCRAPYRVQSSPEVLRQYNKDNHNQTDYGADDEGRDEENLVFVMVSLCRRTASGWSRIETGVEERSRH